MIRRLLGGGVSLLVYACVATVIAQAILAVHLALTWRLDRTRWVQMLAIAQGVDLVAINEEAQRELVDPSQQQISLQEILDTRAVKVHHLELREQALEDGLTQLAYEQRRLTDEKKRYTQLRESFDAELLSLKEGAVADGTENVRLKLESIKANQAKDLLVRMLDNDELEEVVILLAAMPTQKCAKIMGEFKTPSEIEQLNEILRKIRNGYPDFELATDTTQLLDKPKELGP